LEDSGVICNPDNMDSESGFDGAIGLEPLDVHPAINKTAVIKRIFR
jgi:hypothetical protein